MDKINVNALTITTITNFILAFEVFFLAGMYFKIDKTPFTAAWFWSLAMFFLGVGALLGGIDHGFVEPTGHPARRLLEGSNWIILGIMTFCSLMTAARQFFSPRLHTLFLVIGVVQLVVFIILVIGGGRFLVVILNYVPVMLLLLIFNVFGLKDGTGSWAMIVGIVIMAIASMVQAMRVDIFAPLDRNGLYHLIAMVGVVFLYLGGLDLKVS